MGLGSIISKLTNVQFSGEATTIPQLSLASILPSTGEYVTYEGSTTYPGWDLKRILSHENYTNYLIWQSMRSSCFAGTCVYCIHSAKAWVIYIFKTKMILSFIWLCECSRCWETVTWILMNKPVYLLPQEMALLHGLSQATDNRGGEQSGLGGNLRPRQNLNRSAKVYQYSILWIIILCKQRTSLFKRRAFLCLVEKLRCIS